ncbi:MAG: low specificity L-threonine aldolase [Planctomycetaceae bacterium]
MSTLIDFRSDASTLPTPEMRQAMAEAVVGNDDFGEDPTITHLERTVAALLGKEDAVFVHSGTMANLAAVMSHVEPGETVAIGRHFHIFDYEGPAMERVAGCRFQALDDATTDGRTRLLYEQAFIGERQLPGGPRLLCVENTVSRLGGTLIEVSHLSELSTWARSHRMTVHLDGARLFNAAAALNVAPREITQSADTVSLALTKAVGAPAGAIVAASRGLTERIRRNRWMLGGNWKQGGMFAAACLAGLKDVEEVVVQDHAHARRLAEALNDLDGCRVDLDRVVTNIVFWEVDDASLDVEQIRAALREQGIEFGRWKPGTAEGGHRARLVTHRDIRDEQIDLFLDVVKRSFGAMRAK